MRVRVLALALSAAAAFAADVPDDKETPGAIIAAVTHSNIDQTICRRGWSLLKVFHRFRVVVFWRPTPLCRQWSEGAKTVSETQPQTGPVDRKAAYRQREGQPIYAPAWQLPVH